MSAEIASAAHDHAHGRDGDHHHAHHGHAHAPAASDQSRTAAPILAPSLLRLGLGARMLIAGGLVALVWLLILGALS